MSPLACCRCMSTLALVLAACSTPSSAPERTWTPPGDPMPEPKPRVEAQAQAPLESEASAVELTLARALDVALRERPELEEARAAVAVARAEARRARRLSDPTLVGRVEGASLEGDAFDDAELLLGLVQPLPLGGRREAAGRAARLEQEGRAQEAQAALLRVRREVQGAFATSLYAQEVERLQAEGLALVEQGLALVRARRDAGDALEVDVLRSELDVGLARRELQRGQRLARRARTELASSMGRPALAVRSVQGELDASLELPAIETLVRRLEDDPDLLAARLRSEAAAARLELAEAERVPDLNLELFYRRVEASDTDAFDVGVGLPLPLWGASRDRVFEGRQRLARARAAERATRDATESALRSAHQAALGALEDLALNERELLPRAEALHAAARTRFELGDATRAELLEARRAWLDARLVALSARRDVLQAWADLGPYLRDE